MLHLLLAVIYLAFIGLGLPDSLLGAAWPAMYGSLGVPVSYAGILSMLIAACTVVSSLLCDWLIYKLGTGKLMVISVGLTAAALLGFSMCRSFLPLCLLAVPYGLGAGSVDSALNNYVALHYKSRHMSWLHCMWGVGASLGPYVMGRVLTGGMGWYAGYRYVGLLQVGLTAILLLSLPLWKGRAAAADGEPGQKPLTLRQTLAVPGAWAVMGMFFCYCTVEQTACLWASSYLALYRGLPAEKAASWASLFFLGITAGRALSGFLTIKFNDTQMIRLGQGVVLLGVLALLAPLGDMAALIGFVLIGLGCAPIYPSIIHETPAHFGADRSQAMIGVQMASAYTGTCLMPPLFGLIAGYVGVAVLPVFLLAALILMVLMHRLLLHKVGA